MAGVQRNPFSNWTDQLDLPGTERNSFDTAAASVGLSPVLPREERAVPPWRQNSQGQLGLSGLPDPSYRSPWGSQTVTTRADEKLPQSPQPLVPDQYLSVSQRLPPARRSPSQGGFTAPYDPFGVVKAENVGNPTAPQERLNLNLSALVPLPDDSMNAMPSAQFHDNSMNALPLAPPWWDESTMVGPLAPVLDVGTTFVPTTPSHNPGIVARRGLIVENIPRNTPHANVMALFPRSKYDSVEGVNTSQLGSTGRVSIIFADLLEAINAFRRIGRAWPHCEVHYATIGEIVDAGLMGPIISDTVQENGQVAIIVNIDAPSPRGHFESGIDNLVTRVAEAFGGIRYCNRLTVDHATTHEFRVEFLNIHHAVYALVSLNGMELGDYRFKIHIPPQNLVKIRARRSHPPTSPVTPFKSSPHDTMDMALSSPELLTVDNRHRIDIARIKSGEDTRSTIMIRNVPNKYTGTSSITASKAVCSLRLTFSLLTFFFSYSVGYAFVNFGDPQDILIVSARLCELGHNVLTGCSCGTGSAGGNGEILWPNNYCTHSLTAFHRPDSTSEKRAQLSYATTQGLDELIAKFRNSAVMLRPAEERPSGFSTLATEECLDRPLGTGLPLAVLPAHAAAAILLRFPPVCPEKDADPVPPLDPGRVMVRLLRMVANVAGLWGLCRRARPRLLW
ncbi:unnamed protein product [Penicillium salamii]|uniref:Mei2-like C-terminal RNA recognition motif domain-containing protein n=1 Tax=Penicillium salamii TaxID=1612424 RepID=A0A9W4JL47_9EURO|nr:unnamed protein product [Penicillium salamii]CAG8277190.1 unnamed protein product [Penicillium salamii]CAG8277970.1 unnamed protein product [Penicillium salamii]CAG8404764.1 unnamed protein product [Penicillium salamii]CAG8405440.1 unnamed protein product [Penicillium salamii]